LLYICRQFYQYQQPNTENLMSLHTHPIKIRNVQKNTKEAITIEFEIPDRLKSEFDYEPGQYLTLEVEIDGKRERRAYSMCTSPLSDLHPAVTIKRLKGGKVSNYLNDTAKEGQILQVLPPLGNFLVHLNENHRKQYFLFGGGSGITPLMSILKAIISFEKNSTIALLYGNHEKDSIIFYNELAALQNQFPERFTLTHALSIPSSLADGNALSGRIDADKVKQFLQKHNNADLEQEYYICGPEGMIRTVDETLKSIPVGFLYIHKEYFVLEEKAKDPETVVAIENNGATKVTIIIDQQEHQIEVNPNESILDAALDNNIDAPFSCMSAACATCRAKVLSGEVVMDDSEMLSEKELAENYILTCQAHPTTPNVVITYDV